MAIGLVRTWLARQLARRDDEYAELEVWEYDRRRVHLLHIFIIAASDTPSSSAD